MDVEREIDPECRSGLCECSLAVAGVVFRRMIVGCCGFESNPESLCPMCY